MRVFAFASVLFGLLAPATFPSTEKSPHELYDAINALTLDPANVFHLAIADRIELRRGDAVISFEEGTLALFSPLDGRVTGAVFAGHGHVLAAPRDPIEKQQMGRFLGAPVLDQTFSTAYLRFTDDTAGELLAQFRARNLAAQSNPSFLSGWEPALARLNPAYSLRILLDYVSPQPAPAFYASLEDASTGPFDIILDGRREEQFLLGQTIKTAAGTFYDIWESRRLPELPARAVAFQALQYSLETSILPDNALDATATVLLRARAGACRVVTFQLSRALTVDRVTGEKGEPLAFFQNEGMSLRERSARGSDYLYVVLGSPPSQSAEFALRFHYRGHVIEDAGNGVLFVGARESWYPHLGDAADFAAYDLTIRWPRKLLLVATGSKVEEHEEGEFRVGRWRTEKALAVAGFNLGEYASASVASGGHSIAIYANRQLEESLKSRLAASLPDEIPVPSATPGLPSPRLALTLPKPLPSPADTLKQLGKEIDSSIHFYETFSGPFPFASLSVSQIPGTFGQGWPGLLYVSTISFLSPEEQQRMGLTTSSQEHFTELVPYHEVAHQWWGNVVGWSSYRDQWIDEAIANYLALLFADTRKNPEHKLHLWLSRYRRQLTEKSPGEDEPAGDIGSLTLGLRLNSSKSPSAYERVIYSKGSWVMHMLREMLREPGVVGPRADARFTALLQKLVTKYAYRALSTNDLQREVEAVMTPRMDLEGDRSMEWFFDEWVRGTGIPHYRVELSTHRDETGFAVHGKLFQTGVPRSFLAPVPLYASGGHSFLGTVIAAGPETSFHFHSAAAPRKILIDPQMTLLCTME